MHKDRGIQGRQQAIEQLLTAAGRSEPEPVAPAHGAGRVLAGDVFGACPVPEVPCSRRDGYALRASDIAGATVHSPVQLVLAGVIPAEAEHPPALQRGHAVRVLTGGPIPAGADCVVADEQAHVDGGSVYLDAPAGADRHILAKGGDFPQNGRIAGAGERITPQMAAVMVRCRVPSVLVCAVPTAAVFALGAELANPYDDSATGRMPADNVVLATGLLRAGGFEVVQQAVLPDDGVVLQEHLDKTRADLIITTGGTGRSERDVARLGAERAGFASVFHGVDIRPGKGMFAACRQGRILLGLPGPPGAVFACLHAFLPALSVALRGRPLGRPQMAVVEEELRPCKKGEWLLPCVVKRAEGRLVATPLQDKSLAPFAVLAMAQGVLAVPFGPDIPAGGSVELLALGDL